MIALAAATLAGCGSPRTTVVEDASLETAIDYYIDGDLDRAEALFLEITHESHGDEIYRTAYLYLGRIYLARGDYVRAADALSAGRALGADPRLDEYFEVARRRLATTPSRVGQIEAITRGELAALIDHVFGATLRDRYGESGFATDSDSAGGGETEEPVRLVTRTGIMDALPDGAFHAEARVSWPAFYVISCRLAETLGAASSVVNELFPHGYGGTFAAPDNGGQSDSLRPVSGRDALRVCEVLARSLEPGPAR